MLQSVSNARQTRAPRVATLAASVAALLSFAAALAPVGQANAASAAAVQCTGDNAGLSLPPGFCATVFADGIGHARHMVVGADGTVYVNTWSGVYYKNDQPPAGGFLVALKDTKNSGRADLIQRFGDGVPQGSAGGTGIDLYQGALYVEMNDKILRYALPAGAAVPKAPPAIVVSGLPLTGDHPMHPFLIDPQGHLFVDLGSASNSCQTENRMQASPGANPCVEKQTRAGVWRYDAGKTGQTFSAAERYATGLRNAEGMAFDADGRVFATQHGRDQLSQDWAPLYKPDAGPELPSEELVLLEKGADYGWPECYYDGAQKKLVLAPEYGGDGGKAVGLCAQRRPPVAIFPAHWAPNDLLINLDPKFPAAYRDGAFIAFHGSWNRSPAPQDGYNVVFQPLRDGKAAGDYVIFADGFAGAAKEPGKAKYRPAGLASGPDGALYISDDVQGRIWRVSYQGDGSKASVQAAAKPKLAGPATTPASLHAEAGKSGATAKQAIPPGATAAQVALGAKIFTGEASSGTCAGCHGSDGSGTPVGPDLTRGQWVWSDGSLAGLTKTIDAGVMKPRNAPGVMPPKGGAPLSDADVAAVAAYVWSIGHSTPR